MQQFCGHVSSIYNFRFAGFRHDGFFGDVKLFGDNIDNMVGEFGYLRLNVDLLCGDVNKKARPAFKDIKVGKLL